jgi:hypothetical protein
MAGSDEPWHLDKKVPLALIITILLQTSLAIWWASGLDERVAQITTVNGLQDARLADVERSAQAQAIAAATITTQIVGLRETMDQVRTDLRETNAMLRRYLEARP